VITRALPIVPIIQSLVNIHNSSKMRSTSMEPFIAILVALVFLFLIELALCVPRVSVNTTSDHVHSSSSDTDSMEKVQHFRLFRRSAEKITQKVTPSLPGMTRNTIQ